MALLILTLAIVLVIVGAIALLPPDQATGSGASGTNAAQRAPLAEGAEGDEGDEDTEPSMRIPGYYLDWVDAASDGKMFNLTGDDDEPGFYI